MNMRAIFTTILLLGIVNAEVLICFKRNKFSLHGNTDVSSEKVEPFLRTAATELKQTLKFSLDSWIDFPYAYQHIDWHHDAVTLSGNLTDGMVSMDDPRIRLFTLALRGFEIFNLTFPYVYVNGTYEFLGYIGKNGLFNIFGNGPFELEMFNFSVAVTTGLRINSSSLCIPLEINFHLADYTSLFVNFMGGDEDLDPLLNRVIQEIVPDVIRIIPREILDYWDPYVQSIIDKTLHGNTMQNFMQLLGLLTVDTGTLRTFFKEPWMEHFETL